MRSKNIQAPTLASSDPRLHIESSLQQIYVKNALELGRPAQFKQTFSQTARPNTIAIVGAALGDEGKGRIVDNTIEELLKRTSIKHASVIRFQGGNNAGHTVEKDGVKLALHLVPSFVFHEKANGIMDRGMVVDVADLQTEISYIEDAVGNITKRLALSEDAILCTDLERAEESLNGFLQEGSKGGTGRGIGPSYAHHYDKTGLHIADLLQTDWEERLGRKYDQYTKLFKAFDLPLSETAVPDFLQTVKQKKAMKRTVGSKEEFLKRLRMARGWLINVKILTDTFLLHQKIAHDTSHAVLFEGAQAAGLDSWTGTRPDVTSSNTTVYGVRDGTGFWRIQDIQERVGILKLPYTSSVGARRMPTHIDLESGKPPRTSDQKWGLWIREEAHEYGTTTGRPRDINFLDLPFISYNIRMSGIETLIGTHLDIAQAGDEIKIATHYTDQKGAYAPYQPGLSHLKHIKPHFVVIPGWDGAACRAAKRVDDLPIHAIKFLAFLQRALTTPIVATTTGPARKDFITF
jgi:adenylosuccinate synthase